MRVRGQDSRSVGACLSSRWDVGMGGGGAEGLFIGVETIGPHSPLRPRTLQVALPIAPPPPVTVRYQHQLLLQKLNSCKCDVII